MRKLFFAITVWLALCLPAFANMTVQVANEGSTGTANGLLAKLTGAPSTAIKTLTSDTVGIEGVVVSGGGTTGNALIAVAGIAPCTFDASGVVAGHWVITSTVTAGDCADGGAITTIPATQAVGVALATVGSGSTNIIVIPLRPAVSSLLSTDNNWTGKETFTGGAIVPPTTISAAGSLDLTSTSTICGKLVLYTGSTGNLTIPAASSPGCNVGVTAASTGLPSITFAAGGSFHSNTACTATPRTKEAGSTIWVAVQSNAGTAPVVNVSGDCG